MSPRTSQAIVPPAITTRMKMNTRAAQTLSSGATTQLPSSGSTTQLKRHASQIAASQVAIESASLANPRQKPKPADPKQIAMISRSIHDTA